jgi:hypothetical protein
LRNALWSIVSDGPDAAERLSEFVKEYQRLWRAGKAGSPEMMPALPVHRVAAERRPRRCAQCRGERADRFRVLPGHRCGDCRADCDRQFKHLIEQVAARLSGENRNSKV